MQLSEGIKLEGERVKIPDCSRDYLPAFFKERGYKVGAEIGVLNGEFSEKFCKEGLKMYSIDPWTMADYYQHPRGQGRLDHQFAVATERLAPYDCTIIRKPSMEALEDFEDNSLDFIYIDGCHHFRYIAEDLCEWIKKVKPGGMMSGHDFFYSRRTGENSIHVRWVVEAFTMAHDIKPLYILGGQRKQDKWPSWMFFKPKL